MFSLSFMDFYVHSIIIYFNTKERIYKKRITNLEEKDHLSNLLKSGMASCPSAVYDEKRREEPGRFEST